MKKSYLLCTMLSLLLFSAIVRAQTTFPVNDIADPRHGYYALTNATIIKDAATTLNNATLVIRDGKIVSVSANGAVPKGAVEVNCAGKYIYPSFIDIYSDYGMPVPQRQQTGFNFNQPQQLSTNQKGAYGWNQAIKSDVDAIKLFAMDELKAKTLRDLGFGTVLTHQKDGIARGTGTIVTLAGEKENLSVLKEKASAHYSFNKGTSTQNYPSSLMGCIALLRQSYLDGNWYKTHPVSEGVNISLQSWNENQSLPQIFEANDKWNDLRADRIGDEFGVQYIIKGGGNEYQRINDIAATKATYILPLNFPEALDVEDPNEARYVALSDMKHWEMAPLNPGVFEKANIPFCLTSADLKDPKQFFTNLKKAIDNGLSESKALEALTKTPATVLGVYNQVGSLDNGKLANFIICSGPVFNPTSVVLQNWIQGKKYGVKEESWTSIPGIYNLKLTSDKGTTEYSVDVKSATDVTVIGKDSVKAKYSSDGRMISLSFNADKRMRSPSIRLNGMVSADGWSGNGLDAEGNSVYWTATYNKATTLKSDSARKRQQPILAKVTYPFDGYGWEEMPKQENVLFKNATVWTNEKEGILQNTDVLVKNGKIADIGKNLSDASAKVIDGTGKYLTPGIIDEHSHIAVTQSVNEGTQSVTSEVRIADVLNPEDINIYRQLAGGVTSSHILHGSANTIGGQTQLIKLRWGQNDQDIKFQGADPFIKFALGENVKRTTSNANNRFPDTRMGVEEVLTDAFQRAKDYENEWKYYEANKSKGAVQPRKDLKLDALVEVMNSKRFITCHSYVQPEITYMMRTAEKYGFRVNTFTHILEGYKVADKMKAHGANASTFSDWWYYKQEVVDAIPYNAALMQKEGLNVCINSDDAEQARRLNQEAAKTVKYGGVSEEDAFKMVTLNPAKALHVENRVGSIKVGKDADLVLWTDHPLSIYAKPAKTMVDGIVYFDMERDAQMRKQISSERNRLIQKMLGEKRSGMPTAFPRPTFQILMTCGDHKERGDNLITIDSEEVNENN
jgi:Imidazolonepropionase and related amidohydrolases